MGDDSGTGGNDPVYLLRHGASEGVRLQNQHHYLVKHVTKGRLIYDSTVDLIEGDNVLDAGTGAGSWALNLAQQVPSIHIDAVDISTSLFPKDAPDNVTFNQASVAKLPDHWTSRFIFVHQRFLTGGIRASEWPLVMNQIYRVLKPGGSVQLMELDLASWPRRTEPEVKLLRSRDLLAEKNGLLYDTAEKLPKLLQDAGFADIRPETVYIPLGKGAGEEGLTGNASIGGAWRAMKKPVIQANLGVISSEKEYDETVEALEHQWNTEENGARLAVCIICARRL